MTCQTRTNLARFILAVIAFGLLTYGVGPVRGAPATFTGETMAWWDKAGLSIPGRVGQHVHLEATVPADGVIVSGKVQVPVTIRLHDASGKATSFRVSDGSTVKQTWPLSLGPCADCTFSTTVTVDFSTWGTGRREMRWTANVPKNSDGKRQFNSTGWQVCVRSCSPSYRSGIYVEARGWYESRGYANVRLTSDPFALGSGATVKVALKPGSDGSPTKQAGVYIDPNFHAGNAGIVVRQWSSAFTGSVTLPTLAPGPHRLVLLSSDGNNAGVLAVPFEVP